MLERRDGKSVKYKLLGPLRIDSEGEGDLQLNSVKLETLLATLVISANQVVPVGELLAELWEDAPPRRAQAAVYVYVSQLRKLLGSLREGDCLIITRSPGYMLRLNEDETDLSDFRKAIREGRERLSSGSISEASGALERGHALWRGPVLGGLRGGPIINGFTAWLEELRLESLELLIDTNLRLGLHRESVGLLYSLISEHPLREVFYQQLMLALYRSGRMANALTVYQRVHGIIVAELGLEPGRGLRELHRAILLEDRSLDYDAVRSAR